MHMAEADILEQQTSATAQRTWGHGVIHPLDRRYRVWWWVPGRCCAYMSCCSPHRRMLRCDCEVECYVCCSHRHKNIMICRLYLNLVTTSSVCCCCVALIWCWVPANTAMLGDCCWLVMFSRCQLAGTQPHTMSLLQALLHANSCQQQQCRVLQLLLPHAQPVVACRLMLLRHCLAVCHCRQCCTACATTAAVHVGMMRWVSAPIHTIFLLLLLPVCACQVCDGVCCCRHWVVDSFPNGLHERGLQQPTRIGSHNFGGARQALQAQLHPYETNVHGRYVCALFCLWCRPAVWCLCSFLL
jgi:hypothetical protein